jgi:hypothetical protein
MGSPWEEVMVKLPAELLLAVDPSLGGSQALAWDRWGNLFSEQPLMGGGVVGLDEGLMPLLQLQGCGGQGQLIVVQAPLDVEVGFHEVLIALALRADDGLVPELQPSADRFNVGGGVGPATIRDQGLRDPIAQTGRIEHHERDPGGLGRGDRPGEHGPRGALEDDQAPPLDAVNPDI